MTEPSDEMLERIMTKSKGELIKKYTENVPKWAVNIF